jgi:uncharacterized membrane protein
MQSSTEQRLESSLRQGYAVNIGDSIARGWALVSQDLGGFVGFTLVLFLINLAAAIVPMGSLAMLVIAAPLNAGYFWVAFKKLRSQAITFGDFFRGFNYLSPLFLAYLISSLLVFLVALPAIAAGVAFFWPFFADLMTAALEDAEPTAAQMQAIFAKLNPKLLILAALLYLPVIYLSIAYTLFIPFVLDRKMQAWTAIETSRRLITKNWFGFFFLLFVLGLLNFLGALVCGLGLLVTLPLTFCTLAVVYQDIAGLAMPTSLNDSALNDENQI